MTTALATKPSYEERLADAKRELLAAQRVLGEVAHDEADPEQATGRVEDARKLVERLRLGMAAEVREAETAAWAEAERREAINRWMYLAWHAEFIKRIGPVLALRAELRAAEVDAMALVDLTPAVDPEWIRKEEIAGTLESVNLPNTTTIAMHVHGANQHCGGVVTHARTEVLSTEDVAAWAKRLAPLVSQAAKVLGKDANPKNLPWNG